MATDPRLVVSAAVEARIEPPSRPRPHSIGAGRWTRRHSALYSWFVGMAKIVLPAIAAGLTVLVLVWPQLHAVEERFRLRAVAVTLDDLENLRMVNPRYAGHDSQAQPYAISADQATQVAGSSDITDLVKPKADITLKTGTWIAISAENGRFHRQSQRLSLSGQVNLFHDQGYELTTTEAEVDLNGGTAQGDRSVIGQGPDTELAGEGFRVFDKGGRIVLTGRSRIVIHSGAPVRR
jgi:lipopolysaccharide export system protein LptC